MLHSLAACYVDRSQTDFDSFWSIVFTLIFQLCYCKPLFPSVGLSFRAEPPNTRKHTSPLSPRRTQWVHMCVHAYLEARGHLCIPQELSTLFDELVSLGPGAPSSRDLPVSTSIGITSSTIMPSFALESGSHFLDSSLHRYQTPSPKSY